MAAAATDTEQLVVQLEARVSQFEKNFQRAGRVANDNWRKIENRGTSASRKLEQQLARTAAGIGNSFRNMGLAIASSLGAAVSVKAISEAAQQYVTLQNALKVVGVEGAALETTFRDLFQIAQRNGTPIEALVTLYGRATQAQKELKASSADLLKFTNGISLALRVGGTSAQEASGALLQLSQALGSGVVRAEEFNSVNEGARPILQAVAAGLKEAGGSVATLKNLVNEGKVSSEAFFRAFIAGMPMLESAAAKAQGTVSQAMTRIGNAFIVLVGELDKTAGASQNAADNLNKVSSAIEHMPGYLRAASKGLSELQGWLQSIGNQPIWDRINKFFGVDGDAANKRFRALIGAAPDLPNANNRISEFANSPEGRAPALAPIEPVSLKAFPVTGKTTGKSAAQKRADEVETYIKELEKSQRVLQAEYATLGKSNAERQKAIELAKIGEVADSKQRQKLGELVDANEALRQKIEAVKQAQQGLRDAAKFAGEQMADALADVIIDGGKASDVIQSLVRSLARAALQAALLGEGPFGGLFGTKGSNGGLGGIFGAVGKFFGFANGGIMTGRGPVPLRRYENGGIANSPQLAMFGEGKRPEAYVPLPDGRTIPVTIAAPTMQAPAIGGPQTIVSSPTINVTVNGSAGTPDQNTDLATKIARQMKDQAQALFAQELRRQMRPGGLLR